MWFLTVQAIPKPDSMMTDAFGAAAVHCWVNYPAQDGAEQLVNFYLDKEGWMVTNVEHAAWVDPAQYREQDEGFRYAAEAIKDGASFLIQTSLPATV